MKSKTIILSNETEKGRGILTIFEDGELLECRIRLYNIEKLSRFCKIGVYHNQKVFSANILEKDGVYTSSLVGDFNIDQDFYCAIVDTKNNNRVILSGGTYAGFFFNDNSVFDEEFSTNENNFSPAKLNETKTKKPNPLIFNNIEKENPETNLFTYPEPTENECCNDDCERCKNCMYKEYFYSSKNNEIKVDLSENENLKTDEIPTRQTEENFILSSSDSHVSSFETEKPKEKSNEQENSTILNSLVTQFKYVFENYPKDEILTSLIENSKFVKINENKEQFSIGAIFEDDEMKYICYAVMSDYNQPPPSELGEHHQWLPIDKDDPLSEGYFVVFQDAQDLKIVEL